jgi:drug/metabolite transporter (DMT)-like permease
MPPNLIGAGLTLITVAFGLCTGILVKLLGDSMPLLTVLFFRFWLSLPLLFLGTWILRGPDMLNITARKRMLVRIIIGFTTMFCWFSAVRVIPLGEATALFNSSILFVTILSPLMLGEKVGPYRLGAVLAGLAGVWMISAPGGVAWQMGNLYALTGAVTGAFLSVTLRRLGKSESPASVACWYNFGGALIVLAALMVMPQGWATPADTREWLLLIGLGVVGSLLQFTHTASYRYGEAVIVASLRHMQMPMAALVGWLAFSETLEGHELAGGALVLAASWFIIWREFQLYRQRRLQKQAGPAMSMRQDSEN